MTSAVTSSFAAPVAPSDTPVLLAIESSCDETSAAVVGEDLSVRSCITASQIDLHAQFGGVYPEMASRQHVANVLPVVREAMTQAGVVPGQLRSIAVTHGPGLMSSLAVGVNTALALGRAWGVPVIGVNHLRGHVASAELDGAAIDFPAVLLLVSGGHTILARMTSTVDYALIGETRDDSVGEAYDKVSRELGLGYPGGPVLDRLSMSAPPPRGRLPRIMLEDTYDFSFSGLKEATKQLISAAPDLAAEEVAAEFVASVSDLLRRRVTAAVAEFAPRDVVVVGGVAASRPLRAALAQVCKGAGVRLRLPPQQWATDNAAMIGAAGWRSIGSGTTVPAVVSPRLRFDAF